MGWHADPGKNPSPDDLCGSLLSFALHGGNFVAFFNTLTISLKDAAEQVSNQIAFICLMGSKIYNKWPSLLQNSIGM